MSGTRTGRWKVMRICLCTQKKLYLQIRLERNREYPHLRLHMINVSIFEEKPLVPLSDVVVNTKCLHTWDTVSRKQQFASHLCSTRRALIPCSKNHVAVDVLWQVVTSLLFVFYFNEQDQTNI